jgi:hypothetical protein
LLQLFTMKKITYSFLFLSLISFTSCFEIIEQVFVKADGSGNFQLVLNLSKSKTKLNSIRQMKTINGHNVPTEQEIKNKIADIEKATAKIAGISSVKTSMDFDNYIATISCNFNKVNQLNSIIKAVSEIDNKKSKFIEKSYDYDVATNIFSRLNKVSLKKDYNKMSNADKEVFATANYTAIYKFENTVTSVANKDAKVSPSKKGVMLQQNVLDIITEKKSIENKITLIK